MRKLSLILGLLAMAGCSDKLETGYTPKRLDASDSERRAYYAPEFTPESHGSKDDNSPPPDLTLPGRS